MKKAVFGLAKTEDQARKIIQDLQNAGFISESISFLAYDRENRLTRTNANGQLETNPNFSTGNENKHPTQQGGQLGVEKNTKAPEGAATGATAGGIIGGSLGLLMGLGALAIPGVGPFIAAGPIMAALAGSAIGGGVGLLVGSLVGAGLPEYEAKKLEQGLKEGHMLISVETNTSDQIDIAKEILARNGAVDISSVTDKASI